MNNLVQRIVNGVIRQEGESAVSMNPGNLRGAPWLTSPVIEGGFWKPSSRAEGVAGLNHLVALHVAQGNTLTDFIAGHPGVYSGFAPGADGNDPEVYIKNLCEWCVIPDATVPMWNYIGE